VKARLCWLVVVGVALTGCGNSGGLEVARKDGSRVDLRDHVRAWCGAEDSSSIAKGQPRALHFVVGTFPPTRAKPDSYLWVSHRLSALRRNPVFTLGEDEDIPTAYVFDAKTGNEVASNLHGAHGTVRFRDVSCRRGDEVRVSLDTVLVSENGKGPPIHVRGELRAPIRGGQ
jgi:hypothetical protein